MMDFSTLPYEDHGSRHESWRRAKKFISAFSPKSQQDIYKNTSKVGERVFGRLTDLQLTKNFKKSSSTSALAFSPIEVREIRSEIITIILFWIAVKNKSSHNVIKQRFGRTTPAGSKCDCHKSSAATDSSKGKGPTLEKLEINTILCLGARKHPSWFGSITGRRKSENERRCEYCIS